MTISCSDWSEIYNQIRYSSHDTTAISNITDIQEIADDFYDREMVYAIGVLDFKFNRIKQTALTNHEFIQTPVHLTDDHASTNSFSDERAVVASTLSHGIYGDRVRFVLHDWLYLTNVTDETLTNVQVDFGNGQGFQSITFNNIINVNYSSSSQFVEIVVKLIYEHNTTHAVNTYYAHSTVFRTGSSTVPLPAVISSSASNPSGRSIPEIADREFGYPAGGIQKTITSCRPCGRWGTCCETRTVMDLFEELRINILFSPNNNSGKLRRPIIVTDGFDHLNKRDYYTNHISIDPKMPKDNDTRGLYQLLNGDASPWYTGQPDANLIEVLRNYGYDIVIVNFLDGSGNIQHNASLLRGLLNDVLNSPAYRDNNTEEAIMVGPSMGGIISRYALTTMEANGEEHYIRTWYSFDSPQKGAYIPLGFQHAIHFLTKIHTGTIGALEEAKEQFKAAEATLNSPAARSMLLYHFTATTSRGNPTAEFTTLYNELDVLGYPKITKNYALTNGGRSTLYANNSQILDFKIFRWTWATADGHTNVDGTYEIFEGSRQGWSNDEEVSTNQHIAYERAPGGWNASLYTLNCQKDNDHRKADTNVPYTKYTFMPTPSTFGVEVTRSNSASTWESYTAPGATPFDEVHGMEENEEHVTISTATRDYIELELKEDFDNTIRPRVRSGHVINQTVSKPVGYTVKETITFGGSGNTLTFNSTADVNINAGSGIIFKPGLVVKQGANLKATIKAIDYGTLNSARQASVSRQSINLLQVSPFLNTVHNYSNNSEATSETNDISLYPNPATASINIKWHDSGDVILEVYNNNGQLVHEAFVSGNIYQLVTADFQSGLFCVKIKGANSQLKVKKFIKL